MTELSKRVKKAGQPPGTLMYTGTQKDIPSYVEIIHYDEKECQQKKGSSLKECESILKESGINWVNIVGLNNVDLIKEVSKKFHLHPLTVEDVLNVDQRPKIDEYENYLFITIKILYWNDAKHTFKSEQFSIAYAKNFVLTFHEHSIQLFDTIREKIITGSAQRFRDNGSDYLVYRLIDTVVDQYFIVLEGIDQLIEKIEDKIISEPTPQNSRSLYRLKRQVITLRKLIWPMREVLNHLSQADEKYVSSFTRIYFRDVYDHTVQAIDFIETFRDMLSGLLDMYLSSLTNRMNEIMKVLTIISTIFIPITFIASIYGMNFEYMPELRSHYGYPAVLFSMLIVTIVMLIYFRIKKWL